MHIIVFGDSVHYGSADWKNGGWVQLLKQHVEKASGFDDLLYNLSISGEDSKGLLSRIKNEIKPRLEEGGKNIIILSIGTNDSYYFHDNEKNTNINLKNYEINLHKIVNISKRYADTVIFVGLEPQDDSRVQPTPWRKDISYSLNNVIQYNKTARKVCIKEGALFLDIIGSLMKEDYKKLLADGTHPTTEGHKKIFALVLDFLKKNKIVN